MNIALSQLLIGGIILFLITRTFVAYKKNRLSRKFTFGWILFWCGVLLLVFQQSFTSRIAQTVGIGRGVDLVIYISLIIVFFSIYKIFVILNLLDRKLTELTRKLALKDAPRAKNQSTIL